MNQTFFPVRLPMAIIKRAKLSGLGDHIGILQPDGYVFHTTDDKGPHMTTLQGFSAGRQVEIVEEIPMHKYWEAQARIQSELFSGKAYNLLNNNCEVVANRIAGNHPESRQVAFWLMALMLAGVAVVLSK
ncbi:hypothetical protein [Undibacterium aquatile]|uniref:Lecithin:retinol acyltransferase n=1 Tax=Undibacterium aquatile TaxID=1537398 RepID=A0ABR6XAZ4_9BURK|nr:hypothetical protein [Undibacterium aquatile]MBC3810081.1 hypothetical protein [Undibacterium aquatile]